MFLWIPPVWFQYPEMKATAVKFKADLCDFYTSGYIQLYNEAGVIQENTLCKFSKSYVRSLQYSTADVLPTYGRVLFLLRKGPPFPRMCIVPIAKGLIQNIPVRLIIGTNGERENDRRDVIRLTFEECLFKQ